VSTEEDRIWDAQQDERELGPRPPIGYPEESPRYWIHRTVYDDQPGVGMPFSAATVGIVDEYEGGVIYYCHKENADVLLDILEHAELEAAIRDIDPLGHAFHRDGEPCERAVTIHNCPENHRYGRTFEEAR
jgi:hypothetical protein